MSGISGPIDNQRPVEVEPRRTAGSPDVIDEVKSGNMGGANLVIADDHSTDVPGGSVGNLRPVLYPPGINPGVADFQTAAKQMEGGIQLALGTMDKRLGSSTGEVVKDQSLPVISNVEETATSFAANVGKSRVKADFAVSTITVQTNGQNATFDMSGASLSASIDGIPVKYNQEEGRVMADFFMLMELFHEMGTSQRKIGRQARNMANASIVKTIENQAGKQRDAAFSTLMAGMVSGAGKMVSAASSGIGAFRGMNADAASIRAGQPPGSFQGQMMSQKYSAIGSGVEGGFESVASGLRYNASTNEAAQTELRATEEQAKHIKQTEQDQMQAAHDLLSKAKETFAQVQAQIIQTLQNQAKNI